jgi:hypothetical protein
VNKGQPKSTTFGEIKITFSKKVPVTTGLAAELGRLAAGIGITGGSAALL